ncbi:prenyltransferase/squalene oxidase repeat-containing protein [Dactylosporangium sp. NPDC005572]|uniref:prenyltransferase/squalene oxidase repeat-containing protein n=1 Tax=Dactylosporangium sp. NPDC005572 TaxID=3156889 RepID=UPI00339DF7FA
MDSIDTAEIEACVDRSVRLLRRTFRKHGPGGGWYHDLENGPPGPSATAAGLASTLIVARSDEHVADAFAFLKSRQCRSGDRLIDGGWAVNTSNGVPVSECTALVIWLIARCGTHRTPSAPDLRRAVRWLARNQNTDGGWGSFGGQPSRTWLTALSVRALSAARAADPSLRRGVQWLREHCGEAGGWAEMPGAPPTVTHTALVLTALHEAGTPAQDPRLRDGYAWLLQHLDPARLHDDEARYEVYNVTRTSADGSASTWVSAVWHPGLPYAVSALTRHAGELAAPVLFTAVNTLLRGQRADGRWPGVDGAARLSMWDVWPYLDALHDVETMRLAHRGDRLVLLRPGAVLVQRPSVRSVPPARMLTRPRRTRWGSLLRRHWAIGILVVSVVVGAVAGLLGVIAPRELVLGLLVPVILVFVQRAMRPSR